MPQYPFQASETFGQDRLIASLTQIETETVVLTMGIIYRRGMVLGRVSANNKMMLSAAAAVDGSQVPYGICIDDVDATLADQVCGAYVKGGFNQLALILGAGQTIANIHDPLRDAGIFLKAVVPA